MSNINQTSETKPTFTRHLKDYTPPPYLIPATKLHFTLDPEHTTVEATLHFKLNSALNSVSSNQSDQGLPAPAELFLHGEELTLKKIAWSKTADQSATLTELIELTEGIHYRKELNHIGEAGISLLHPPAEFFLHTTVVIHPIKNTKLDGLYLSDTVLVTQCEPEGFRRITYYLDRSDVLSTFTVSLTADEKRYPVLLCNGNQGSTELGEGGQHTITFHDPFPKPSYLFAVVAGNLEVLTDYFTTASGKRVCLRIFAEPTPGVSPEHSRITRCTYAMEALKLSMKWDEETYGVEYDLANYNIVVVDSFNLGAMENKGLNIFNCALILFDQRTATDHEQFTVAETIAHEYFHNWTGNRVTVRDWFQLTLKEGLTVYRDQCFSATFDSPAVRRIKNVAFLRRNQFPEDRSTLAHPIQPQSYISMNNFYTVTVYYKGAEIIGMYETILGKKRYLEAVKQYLRKYDGQAVTVNEFFAAMQALYPENISTFKRWYTTPGTPTVSVKTKYHSVTGSYEVTLTQKLPIPKANNLPETLPLLIPLCFSVNVWSHDKAVCVSHGTWLLREHEETRSFIIPPISTGAPFLSINENFSAPVIVERNLSLQEWIEQFKIEGNPFLKWDTLQQIYLQLFNETAKAPLSLSEHPLFKSTVISIANILRHTLSPLLDAMQDTPDLTRISQFLHYDMVNLRYLGDLSFLAELFKFPNFYELSQGMEEINFERIRVFENSFKTELVQNLSNELALIYHTLSDLHLHPDQIKPYPANTSNAPHGKRDLVGERELKNTVLRLLAGSSEGSAQEEWRTKAIKQCQTTLNFNDEFAGLQAALASGTRSASVAELIEEFYQKWRDDNLVINRWISALAGVAEEHTFTQVLRIQELPEFKITEPNKGKALFRCFIRDNPHFMNHVSGRGYEIACDFINKLDTINPILGADLLAYFPDLSQLPTPQRELLANMLKKMVTYIRSKDILEILDKKLGK